MAHFKVLPSNFPLPLQVGQGRAFFSLVGRAEGDLVLDATDGRDDDDEPPAALFKQRAFHRENSPVGGWSASFSAAASAL